MFCLNITLATLLGTRLSEQPLQLLRSSTSHTTGSLASAALLKGEGWCGGED